MLIALWILNGVLALIFVMAGATKIVRPKAALVGSGMSWAEDYNHPNIKLLGGAEVLGAVGLILPLLTGVLPILTPIAATALAAVMIGAVVVHIRRREPAVPAIALAVLSLVSAVLGFIVTTA